MQAWLTENWGTIIVALVLIGIVGAIIAHLIGERKKGRSACGCGCAKCGMSGVCHPKEKK